MTSKIRVDAEMLEFESAQRNDLNAHDNPMIWANSGCTSPKMGSPRAAPKPNTTSSPAMTKAVGLAEEIPSHDDILTERFRSSDTTCPKVGPAITSDGRIKTGEKIMPVETENRERVRLLLNKANVEIGSALKRVDNMGPFELAEAAGAAESARAFFDFNGSCGSSAESLKGVDGTRAFFDFNGSCGGASVEAERGIALINALRGAIR